MFHRNNWKFMVICLRMGVVVDDFPRFPGILDGRCSSFWPWRNAMPCAKGVKKDVANVLS
jgi:hypothetical protein